MSWPRAEESSDRTAKFGRMSPGREAEGRTRWRRPSGWVTVPSFSAWVSSGKTTSALAVVAFSNIEKETTKSAAVRAASQAGVSGKSRRGSTPKRTTDVISPDSRAARICSVDMPGVIEERPGPASGRQPASRRPRALAKSGISSSPAPSGRVEAERGGEVEQGGDGAVALAGDALAPEHDDALGVLEGLGQRRGDVLGAAQSRRQLGDEVGGAAGSEAGDRLGAAVERGRPLGRDRESGAVAADRLADAQVEDRRAVQGVGAEDEDHVGVVDVANLGGEVRLRQRHQRLAAGAARGARVDVRWSRAPRAQCRCSR